MPERMQTSGPLVMLVMMWMNVMCKNTNDVYCVILGGPHSASEDLNFWFFGYVGDDVDECECCCKIQPNCSAFTHGVVDDS